MIPVLAQSTQPLSHEAIGMIVLALAFLTRWLWDYNRQRREENQQFEPRATPPLHKEYVSKDEHRSLLERFEQEQVSQAGKRKGMYQKIEALGQDVAKLQVETTSQTRQLHSLDTKLENMPEKIVRLLQK